MSYTKPVIYPYSLNSQSARLLSSTLNTKCVRVNGLYRHKKTDLIVNWGNSRIANWMGPEVVRQHMLNKPQYVSLASHKIKTFQHLSENMADCLPDWTTSQAKAASWLSKPKYGESLNAVVVRTLTQANSGRGIVLAKTPDEVVPAPLYTRYKPKKAEYRVHVSARTGVFDVQQKKKRSDAVNESHNAYIRSYDNGWVFCRENIKIPDVIKECAERALLALHLDFGAIDIGYHDKYGVCIYEINTAPGIAGQTLSNYVNMIKQHLNGD